LSGSAVRMLALGDFLALTLPNFRLEDQKILVVFPPVFQLIHHLPRDGALQIGPRSVSRVGARRDHFLAGQIRNRVETEFSPHGLRGEPRFARSRSINAVTSLRVARYSVSALSISSAGAPPSTASS